eukprot:789989-Pelagomonas_calceolata.AAC.1
MATPSLFVKESQEKDAMSHISSVNHSAHQQYSPPPNEVHSHFFGASGKNVKFFHSHAYLPLQLLPVHAESCIAIPQQLLSFAAVVVGVEHKTACVKALEQDHPH